VDLFERLESPAAVVSSDNVFRLISTEFSERFPECVVGKSINTMVQGNSALSISALGELVAGASDKISFWLHDRTMELRAERVDQENVILILKNSTDSAVRVHEYMQERDSMFSTSRTVSVSVMATTLAHEINTPVGTISNLLSGVHSRLAAQENTSPEILAALDSALEQTYFTRDIIHRIRDYTQARQPNRELLDCAQLIKDAAVLLDWYFDMQNCRVSIVQPEKTMTVLGDRVMLQQIIINLFRNAADAMQAVAVENRLIEVTLVVHRLSVRILIRDFGSGLSDADSMYTPFVSEKPDGMGVGLSICRSFLELHRGRMWLTDASTEEAYKKNGQPGEGCVATIELPLEEIS